MGDKSHDDDVAFIEALADLLRSKDLSELEVSRDFGEDDRLKVRLRRGSVHAPPPTPLPPPVPDVSAPAAPQPPATPASPVEEIANHPGAVTSPMVGTAYLQSEPGAAPFVRIGQDVAEGDTLLIVEAMKTMNAIKAPRAGKVAKVLARNAEPVEYDEPLVILGA